MRDNNDQDNDDDQNNNSGMTEAELKEHLKQWTPPRAGDVERDDVSKKIKELTDERAIEQSDVPRFYLHSEERRGYLFAVVLSGPRLFIDPTAKESVPGTTHPRIQNHPEFEETNSWKDSLGYSISLSGKSEIPDVVEFAIEWSYKKIQQRKLYN